MKFFNKLLEFILTIICLFANVNFWRVLILFGMFAAIGALFFTSGMANFLMGRIGDWIGGLIPRLSW